MVPFHYDHLLRSAAIGSTSPTSASKRTNRLLADLSVLIGVTAESSPNRTLSCRTDLLPFEGVRQLSCATKKCQSNGEGSQTKKREVLFLFKNPIRRRRRSQGDKYWAFVDERESQLGCLEIASTPNLVESIEEEGEPRLHVPVTEKVFQIDGQESLRQTASGSSGPL